MSHALISDRRFTVDRTSDQMVTVTVDASGPDFEWGLLVVSDSHRDNPKSDRSMENRHLAMAADNGYGIIHLGDMFDAMQGRNDRRRSNGDMEPEIQAIMAKERVPYADALIIWMAGEYAPYMSNLVAVGEGNHESAVDKFMETSLRYRFVKAMRDMGSPVVSMPYMWFTRVVLNQGGVSGKGGTIGDVNLACFHGTGGDAPVTKGALAMYRTCANLEGVDAVLSGHLHKRLHIPHARWVPKRNGTIATREIECIQIGGYKQDTKGGVGWAVEKGHSPSTLGAALIKFTWRTMRSKTGTMRRVPRVEVSLLK